LRALFARNASSIAGDESTARTSAPAATRCSVSSPVPHPKPMTDAPSRSTSWSARTGWSDVNAAV